MYDSFDGKVLIDERSQVEIYIGNSVGFSDENLSIWKIKNMESRYCLVFWIS